MYKIPSVYGDLMSTSRLEKEYSHTALDEKIFEKPLITKDLLSGHPIKSSERKWDVGVTQEFLEKRLKRSKIYEKYAKLIKKYPEKSEEFIKNMHKELNKIKV